MIESICQNCGNKKLFSDDKDGKKYKCPNCNEIITIQSINTTIANEHQVNVTNAYADSIAKAEQENKTAELQQQYQKILNKSKNWDGLGTFFYIIAAITIILIIKGDYAQVLSLFLWGGLGLYFKKKSKEFKESANIFYNEPITTDPTSSFKQSSNNKLNKETEVIQVLDAIPEQQNEALSPLAVESIAPKTFVENKEVLQTDMVIDYPASKSNKSKYIIGTLAGILIILGIMFLIEREKSEKASTSSQKEANNTSTKQSRSSGKYQQASERVLTGSDVIKLNKHELKIMRNEIYARYGYIFTSNDLREYFAKQSWYNPQYADVTSMLTDLERSNISFLKRMEENSNTTIAALFQVSGNEAIGSETNSAVSGKVQQFIKDGNLQNVSALLDYFSFPVRRYYEVTGYGYDALKKRYERYYYEVLASHKITVNWTQSYISKTPDGYHIELNAGYEYSTKKMPTDIHNLNTTIIINLNGGYQIIDMYEVN